MYKKPNLNHSALFMAISVIALFIFALFIFLLPLIRSTYFTPDSQQVKGTYYLNDDYQSPDPLFTQAPNLDDIIAGPIITELDPAIGLTDATVNIVVYTDFTCQYCGQSMQAASQVQTKFPESTRLIHKDFPKNDQTYISYQAAVAGRCAQEQNKFWEISELLYQNYNQINYDLFIDLAKNIGLNISKFKLCLNNKDGDSVFSLINDNIKEANALQITGVPLLYINDQQILGEANYGEIMEMVKKELNK